MHMKIPPDAPVPWIVEDFSEVGSTSTVASGRPVWTVIRARCQTSGRGRHARVWVSDEGGLWMSVVLPPGSGKRPPTLSPLIVGLALYRVCAGMGVKGLRLRWPNDLLVGDRKLAGVLLERPSEDRVVAGIGLNLTNDPELKAPELRGTTVALKSLLRDVPARDEVTALILAELAVLFGGGATGGVEDFCVEINRCWNGERNVQLEVDRENITGIFTGVDAMGNPRLRKEDGSEMTVTGAHVWKLTEIK